METRNNLCLALSVTRHLTGRAVHPQFKGQGPVGSSFTGHHLPARQQKTINTGYLLRHGIQEKTYAKSYQKHIT